MSEQTQGIDEKYAELAQKNPGVDYAGQRLEEYNSYIADLEAENARLQELMEANDEAIGIALTDLTDQRDNLQRLNTQIHEVNENHVLEVARLQARYVGNREDCGHLKCFTYAPGLLVEGCQACDSDRYKALAEEALAETVTQEGRLTAAEALAERRGEALRRFLNLHPFAREAGVCISCDGKAKDYPGQIHFNGCLWVQIGNDAALAATPDEAATR